MDFGIHEDPGTSLTEDNKEWLYGWLCMLYAQL